MKDDETLNPMHMWGSKNPNSLLDTPWPTSYTTQTESCRLWCQTKLG